MRLALRTRRATKDVDAWFWPAPEDHEAVRAVAADHDLRLGLKSAADVLEVVSARQINYLNTITVNGVAANRTSLGTPVQTPWGSADDGLTPGNWLIWDGVIPVAGAITITDQAASGTLAIINAVRILGSSRGEQVIPTLSGLGALILALGMAGAAVRLLRG